MKNVLFAAVAVLFAVSAHAHNHGTELKEVAGATEASCKTAGDTWKDGKCWHAEAPAADAKAAKTETKKK
jgi:hypothetical protein